MEYFILTLFYIGGALLMALVCTYTVFLVDSAGGEDLPTTAQAVSVVAELIKKHEPNTKVVWDLGAGKGWFALRLVGLLPTVSVVGYEKSALRVWFANWTARLLKRNAHFSSIDFFSLDFSKAKDVVIYAYVPWEIVERLETVLIAARYQGLIITNSTHFKEVEPLFSTEVHPGDSKFEKIYVYRLK